MSLTNANSLDFRHERELNPRFDAASSRKPGWGSWLAFLFVGACALALAYTEQLIAWSLSQDIFDEGTTRSLPTALRYAAMAGVLLGVITAWRILLWITHGIARWAPARALFSYMAPALNPVLALTAATVVTPAKWLGDSLLSLGQSAGRGAVHAWHVGVIAGGHAVKGIRLGVRGLGWMLGGAGSGLRLLYFGAKAAIAFPALAVAAILVELGRLTGHGLSYSWPKIVAATRIAALPLGIGWQKLTALLANLRGTGQWAIAATLAGVGLLGWALGYFFSLLLMPVRGIYSLAQAVGSWLRVRFIATGPGVARGSSRLWRVVASLARMVSAPLRWLVLGVIWFLTLVVEACLAIARGLDWVLALSARAIANSRMLLGRSIVAMARRACQPLIYLGRGAYLVLQHLAQGVGYGGQLVGIGLRYGWFGLTKLLGYLAAGLTMMAQGVGLGLNLLGRGLTATYNALGLGVADIARAVAALVNLAGSIIGSILGALGLAATVTARTVTWPLKYLWSGISTTAGAVATGAGATAHALGMGLRQLGTAIVSVLELVWLGTAQTLKLLSLPLGFLWLGVATASAAVAAGGGASARTFGAGMRWLGALTGSGLGLLGLGAIGLLKILGLPLKFLWLGISTGAYTLGWGSRWIWRRVVLALLRGLLKSIIFPIRVVATAYVTIPDVVRMTVWVIKHRMEVPNMSDFNLTRQRLLSLIGTLWALGIGLIFVGAAFWQPPEPTVPVIHWTTGHLTRDGLLKDMAVEFNKANHRTDSDTKIVVEVYDAPSELQGEYLSDLLRFGTRRDLNEETNGYVVKNIPDPVIVTPSSAHWLVTTNYEVGRPVVNLDAAQSIVRPVIGIVTYEEMARCLGWPRKEIGFADIIELRNDPQGWGSYGCAKAEWGQKPLLAFTDPTTSSTGRSLHLSLYAFAAGKSPEALTVEDVSNPEVVQRVKEFQGLIDHYQIGTTVLNTKIHQGPRYGHFFIMPEDNLIHLYEGTERAFINGIKTTAPPIEDRMVMMYPKEGAMPRKNCACIVQADWVSEEQVEASQQWIDYIREDEQQRVFMAAGFRPGTDLDLQYPGSKISNEFGLNPDEPKAVLNPSLTTPEVAATIDQNWEQVKRPAVVTFVVDTSGSMIGTKIKKTEEGIIRALDAMARNNQVGLVTFSDAVDSQVPVAPWQENRFVIAEAARNLQAQGETALYDAIKRGIEMTDSAPADPEAIRGVVVLTDGQANRCRSTDLDDLIRMESTGEKVIIEFSGCEGDALARDSVNRSVDRTKVIGTELALDTQHPVQIFFIGIGDDADLEVGRVLSQATGAEFQGVTEEDLAKVLEEFSKYF